MLILASSSPRRKEILSMITTNFKVVVPTAEEIIPSNKTAQEAVVILAKQKAHEVFSAHSNDIVIASDTVVELNNEILGKPLSPDESRCHLNKLSGVTHNVHTGVHIMSNEHNYSFCSTAAVTFDHLTQAEIGDYINTKEPSDKAGSYAVQGLGGRFVKSISGDYYTVMGLPLNKLYRYLSDNKLL